MNHRKLLKELGLNHKLKVRDFYASILFEEESEFNGLSDLRKFIEIGKDDMVVLISLDRSKSRSKGSFKKLVNKLRKTHAKNKARKRRNQAN